MKFLKLNKQLLSALLICILISGLFPVQTFAAGETSACTVAVNVGSNRCTFTVPFGSSLDITWKFTEENGIPKGYLMAVNGQLPVKSGYGYTYSNIAPVKVISAGSSAVMTVTGKPDSLCVTPTEEQCMTGQTITLSTSPVPLTKEQCEFEVVYVNRENNQAVGTFKDSAGSGYHASQRYGISEISTSTAQLRDYVTQNLKGYRLYRGTVGSVDKQTIQLKVGEDGVSPKSVTMYVEVNHDVISDLHTQKVCFTYKGTTVFETNVPMKTNHNVGEETIALDLSGIKAKLNELGYTFDDAKAYTTVCNGYTHNPEVTAIEVTDWFPYEYKTADDSVIITKYLGFDTDVAVPAEIEGKPVTALDADAFAGNSKLTSVTLPASITSVGARSFADCTALSKIDMGKNVASIAESACTGSPNVTIHGYPDSAALTFAKENNLNFVCKEHSFGEWQVSKKPTCTEKGEESRSCSCGETESRPLDTVEHSFGEWQISKKPTCTEKGEESRSCSCGETESRPLDAIEHSFGEWQISKKPTCTEKGEESRSCSCGETESQPLDTVEHSFGEWQISKKPTCTEKGEESRSCSCGETESRPLDTIEHSFGEWQVSKKPTATETGIKERICSVCAEKETEKIPVLTVSSKPSKDKTSGTSSISGTSVKTEKTVNTVKAVKTGDNTLLFLWITVLLISGTGILAIYRKKHIK